MWSTRTARQSGLKGDGRWSSARPTMARLASHRLDTLARWSQVAPQPLAVDQLRPLLTAEHLFPEDPLFGDLPVALGIQPPPEPSPWKRLQRR